MTSSPIKIIAICLILMSILSPATEAQKLNGKAKNQLRKQLAAYHKGKTEEQKDEALNLILCFGRPGLAFIETQGKKKDLIPSIEAIKEAAPQLLGHDILKKKIKAKPGIYTPSFFACEEVVLLKKGEEFAGFRVIETPAMAKGELKYEFWYQKGRAKKLIQPGGEHETLTVAGRKMPKPLKPNAGYDEYEYDLKLGPIKACIRFIGPAYFLFKYDGKYGVSLSGKKSFKGFNIEDKETRYDTKFPEAFGNMKGLLQEYIQRTVPGCEPLPLDEEDKSDFAQYEAVQIRLRQTRLSGEAIVLVQFTDPNSITFAAHMTQFIRNFANEILPVNEKSLLISLGSAASLEGNQYWSKDKWDKVSSKQKKVLRANFPEDY